MLSFDRSFRSCTLSQACPLIFDCLTIHGRWRFDFVIFDEVNVEVFSLFSLTGLLLGLDAS